MDRKYLLNKAIKAAKLARLIAKAFDIFIVFCFSIWFYPLGLILGIIYISLSDGISKGQSAGKRLMGFAVKSLEDGQPCSYKQSAIRNLPFSIPLFIALVLPIIGLVIGAILGVALIGFELYLLYNLDSGHRLGDVMADTSVMANDDHSFGIKNQKTNWFTSSTNQT